MLQPNGVLQMLLGCLMIVTRYGFGVARSAAVGLPTSGEEDPLSVGG